MRLHGEQRWLEYHCFERPHRTPELPNVPRGTLPIGCRISHELHRPTAIARLPSPRRRVSPGFVHDRWQNSKEAHGACKAQGQLDALSATGRYGRSFGLCCDDGYATSTDPHLAPPLHLKHLLATACAGPYEASQKTVATVQHGAQLGWVAANPRWP